MYKSEADSANLRISAGRPAAPINGGDAMKASRWLRGLAGIGTTAVVLGAGGCGSDNASNKSAPAAAGSTPAAGQLQPPTEWKKKGSFTDCVDVSYPVAEYYESGNQSEPVGFDIDLVKAIAKRWGIDAKIVPTEFPGLLPGLASGQCQVSMSGIQVLPDRTKQFPAIPYLDTHRVLLVGKGNPQGIAGPDDLSGKTVATQGGTSYPGRLEDINKDLKGHGKPPMKIQLYPKASDATQQLIVGRADAVLTQNTEGVYRVRESGGKIEVSYEFPASEPFGIYYRRNEPDVGAAWQKAVEALQQDGTMKKIAEKYGLDPKTAEISAAPQGA
jgi:polar amino acid transport system substrate-binding protein